MRNKEKYTLTYSSLEVKRKGTFSKPKLVLVESRRSIRAYKEGTTISPEDLEAMIECAGQAPSWKNSQTGRYYVIRDEQKLAQFRANTLPEFNRDRSANAAALIVTAFEKDQAGFNPEGKPDNELGNHWGAYDLGLQNQLLILKARELGYDTLIMGIRDADAIRKELNIPDSQEIVSVIAGHIRQLNGKRLKDDATIIATQIVRC